MKIIIKNLSGLRSICIKSLISRRKAAGLSIKTVFVRIRCFRYSLKRRKNEMKCNAFRIVPGTASFKIISGRTENQISEIVLCFYKKTLQRFWTVKVKNKPGFAKTWSFVRSSSIRLNPSTKRSYSTRNCSLFSSLNLKIIYCSIWNMPTIYKFPKVL